MTLQVLAAAMFQTPQELISKMNIASDALIINQCDTYGYEEIEENGHRIRCFHMAERGVGLSRNNALMRADHTISLFADDDIVYEADYEKKVLEAFENNPQADVLLFNVLAAPGRRTYFIKESGRVRWYNCGRYPAYSIAVRTERVRKRNVTFSLLFGGGAKYSAGEDSLFLRDCIRKGLKVYKVPVLLGSETPGESTWFFGYNEKFFFDRGVLYHYLYGKLKYFMGLRFILAQRKEMCQEISWRKAYRHMRAGMKEAAR